MELRYCDNDLPGTTSVCLDPRHEEACTLPCPGCEADCDPTFRSTLAHMRRSNEIDTWLQEIGAHVIQVEDLEEE